MPSSSHFSSPHIGHSTVRTLARICSLICLTLAAFASASSSTFSSLALCIRLQLHVLVDSAHSCVHKTYTSGNLVRKLKEHCNQQCCLGKNELEVGSAHDRLQPQRLLHPSNGCCATRDQRSGLQIVINFEPFKRNSLERQAVNSLIASIKCKAL
jgi:hypothetical protein